MIKISKRYLGKHNGLYIIEFDPCDMELLYWDRPKSQASKYNTAFNCGFFGYFSEVVNGKRENFTLPVANLACSTAAGIPSLSKKYIEEWTGQPIRNNHFELNVNQGTAKLKGKYVSTFIIDNNNKVSIQDVNTIPKNTRVAVAGAPCIKNGDDVDFYGYVKLQGWGSDIFRSTYHTWLAVKNQKAYLIAGKSYTANMIYGMWFWKQVRDLKFDSCILLDGGGSHFSRFDGKWLTRTWEDRRINNIAVING